MAPFLTYLGAAALSLAAAHGHSAHAETVSPHVAARGQEVRVALPSHLRASAGLVAKIRVAGTTTEERPVRTTRRYVWVRVDIPKPTGRPASSASGTVRARLTLASGGRRVLATSFELKTGPADAEPEISPTEPLTNSPAGEPVGAVTAAAPPADEGPAPESPSALPSGVESHDVLRWAPPALTEPTVVDVPSGEDPARLSLSTSRDYVVVLPSEGIHGTLEINGGHNVDLIGGEITVPASADQTDNGADDTDTAIYVRASTGTVHIEGVLIHADPGVQFDGIDVSAPQATVQVENVRMEDVYGTRTGEHADVIQTWGGVRELDVDGLTANGDYQGLTVAPDLGAVESIHLEDVDMTAEAAPPSLSTITVGGGIMLWLTHGTTTCQSATVTLQDVYIANLTGRILPTNTVWPSPSSGLACAPVVAADTISWPGLPVSGGVTMGAPPQGSFVPEGIAGAAYISPGYQPS